MSVFVPSLFSILRINNHFDPLFARDGKHIFHYVLKYHSKSRQSYDDLPSIIKNSLFHSASQELAHDDNTASAKFGLYLYATL